ncbi:MAG: hypothetical protein QHH10_08405 [Peptococcaceae bacterium]|jgi:hypothetical protein|nr:hypothetical protein [Peptococcaceae bacterium]MDH7525316.1 hypothetical protein [Peptococcaceae bacterium]
MYVITITRWKKKLAALLVLVAIFIGLGLGINHLLTPGDSRVNAPVDQGLQKDVISQPVKVQGQPAEIQNKPDQETTPKVKEK